MQTPLHVGVESGHLEVVQVLLAGGASLEAREKVGGSVMVMQPSKRISYNHQHSCVCVCLCCQLLQSCNAVIYNINNSYFTVQSADPSTH